MPTFELDKKDWFTPQMVAENDYINEKNSAEDLVKFGKTYQVKFEQDAETYMWTAKTEPEVGKKYYGHLQKTSGRSIRFKVDKEEEGAVVPKEAQSNFETVDKQDSIHRSVALNDAAIVYQGLGAIDSEEILFLADKFYAWLTHAEVPTIETDLGIVDPFPKDEEDHGE